MPHSSDFSPPAIQAQQLVKYFGDVCALSIDSLSIEQGELFFLLGSSGCGKTTLLRCIAGLEKPTQGKIFYGKKDVTALPTHKREAAMVFQSYALWPHMTVSQNIAFGLEQRKLPKQAITQRVNEALDMVHLKGFGSRKIDAMSGGQQQRVALARALVVRPTCLLLDEPLSNLDAQLRIEMRAEIRRIVKTNNLTGIYVTHDQQEALSMADRIAVLHKGIIQQIGTPQEIYAQPINAFVASFIGETTIIQATKPQQLGEYILLETPLGNLRTRSLPSITSSHNLALSLRPESFHVVEPHTTPPANHNIISGHIASFTYLGHCARYAIILHNGETLLMNENNPHTIRHQGDPICLSIDPKDTILVTR